MVEVREVLRLWLRGHGYRAIARLLQADRKTVHRYVEAGARVGLEREGGEGQLSDELLGALAEQLRPGHRGNDHGASWRRLEVERGFITERQQEGLRLTKIHSLLARGAGSLPDTTSLLCGRAGVRSPAPHGAGG